jgi:phage terminase large subunit-like protein
VARIPPCDRDRCPEVGAHLCLPRIERVEGIFSRLLVHTKGRWARQPFHLARWQHEEIVDPLFGRVEWSHELRRYVRQYRVAWLEMARKNGKSELMAGFGLVLLCGDDEEGAEIYGCARDIAQARKVYDVAQRMVELSPTLSRRLRIYRQAKRIADFRTGSWYEVVAADAAGNLGHNPHGVLFDEVLTQPSRELWDAFRTALSTREQPLMIAATTAGDDEVGLCSEEHDYTERVIRNPRLDPRRFGFIRNTPKDADWTDPKQWRHANPALGDFKLLSAMKDSAREAQASPVKVKAFRQFELNTWGTTSVTKWVDLALWDQTAGMAVRDRLRGRDCYAGLDLASSTDLAALCLTFVEIDPSVGAPGEDQRVVIALWRFWAPEMRRADLDDRTGGQASVWARQGYLRFTPGDVIDYKAILSDLDADAQDFQILELAYDRWGMVQLSQDLMEAGLTLVPLAQGYATMSAPTKEWERLVRQQRYRHGGNPVMRWMVDNIRIRTDADGNVRIDKGRSFEKVDGPVASVMALSRALLVREPEGTSAYEDHGLVTLR